MSEDLSEKDALNKLIKIYLSHTTKWYSALIAITLGLLGIPLFALGAYLRGDSNFGLPERVLLSVLLLVFLLAAFYTVAKVIYSLALLDKFYSELKMGGDRTLKSYLFDLKTKLHGEGAFRHYKIGKNGNYKTLNYSSFVGFLIIGIILFYFIWWKYDSFFWFVIPWHAGIASFIISYLFVSRIIRIF